MAKTHAPQEASLAAVGGGACRPAEALGDVSRHRRADLRRLPLDVRLRVADKLRGLANDPRPVGSRKLAGTKHDWRIRVSDYRVVYEIAETAKIVRVYRVRRRREVYR